MTHTDYEIEPDTFPPSLLDDDRWFVWKRDQGRKIPRAPWAHDGNDIYVSWKDEPNWTNFETINDWVDHGLGYRPATAIPDCEPDEQRLVLFDFDDCRDPESGEIHPEAWEFIQKHELHAAISTSGTGLHGYGYTTIPEGRKPSFVVPMAEWEHGEAELEVYANARFVAMTGNHIAETPLSAPEVSGLFTDMADEHGRIETEAEAHEPTQTREQVSRKEHTGDIEDVFDAVAHTRPSDIRLKSTVTNQRSAGPDSMDPSWEHSESGTRLAQFDDHWLYRKGNHRLDALQLVALEERIITSADAYPEGEAFWDAVDALRDRGAHIPQLVKSKKERQTNEPVETDDTPTAMHDDPADDADLWDNATGIYAAAEDGEDKQKARHQIASALVEYDLYRTHDESGHLYRYDPDRGYYRPRGENRLRETLADNLRHHFSNREANEIQSMVEARTFIDDFAPPDGKICCRNGVLDIETRELEPHNSAYEFQARLDAAFVEGAEPELFERFLEDIIPRESDRKKIQEFAGYCLMHWGLPFHKALFLVGPQASGKSTLLDTIAALFDDNALTNLTPQELTNPDQRFKRSKLRGAWVNIRNDISDEMIQNVGMFKEIVAGDSVTAERKYEQAFEFTPTAKHIFASNKLPDASVDDDAFYRRILLASAPRTIPRERRDPELPEKLLSELPAVLNWALDGLDRLLENRMFTADMPPDETRDKWEAWGSSAERWKQDALESHPDNSLPKDTAYRSYQEFCEAKGLPAVSKRKLTQTLHKDKDIDSSKTTRDGNTVRCYTGAALKPEWEPKSKAETERDSQAVGLGEYGDE
jgi:P4 family phage/plasmid primase-like protien